MTTLLHDFGVCKIDSEKEHKSRRRDPELVMDNWNFEKVRCYKVFHLARISLQEQLELCNSSLIMRGVVTVIGEGKDHSSSSGMR